MGIHGIYREIGSGRRIALSKFALDTFISKKRPLRLAVDISIWLFQIKASKGGEQPALRTFYYRLLRLTSLAINPLFVFDGPNKPKFKRNRHTGPNICTIPEFLAKQLLKEFGLPYHIAPGEAEAECAHLQRAGIVDAVLSEDVDTIMFGSSVTMRNWTAEGKGKIPTHINVYDSQDIQRGSSGLDKEGMILIAMMSGGDYIPEGIPGCGPKTACEAARAGFGSKLCRIDRGDKTAFEAWKTELAHELRSNESKFFRVKHGALQIPESFPNRDILRYYTHPMVSSMDKIRELNHSIVWQQPIQLAALRRFTEEAFKWETITGAKKFIRTLAPALLVRELITKGKSDLVLNIHQSRNHMSTDQATELRVSYVPGAVVDIDLSQEAPECPAYPDVDAANEEEDAAVDEDVVPSGSQMRPYLFDPSEVTKAWIFEHYIQLGASQQYADWQKVAAARAAKALRNVSHDNRQVQHKKRGIDASMPAGSLHRFTRVTKPAAMATASADTINDAQKLPFPNLPATSYSNREPYRSSRSITSMQEKSGIAPAETSLVVAAEDPTNQNNGENVISIARPARSTLIRSRTEGSVALSTEVLDLTLDAAKGKPRRQPSSRTNLTWKRKADDGSPSGLPRASRKAHSNSSEPIIISSSPTRQSSIINYLSPPRSNRQPTPIIDAPASPTQRLGTKAFNLPVMLSQDDQTLATDLTTQRCSQKTTLSAVRSSITIQLSPIAHHNDQSSITQSSADRSMLTSASLSSAVMQSMREDTVTWMKSSSASTCQPKLVRSSQDYLKPCEGNEQRIRVRESLHGAFAVENSQANASAAQRPLKNIWQMQGVSVVDLTAD